MYPTRVPATRDSVPSRVPLSFLASNLASGAERPTPRAWLARAELHEVRQHLMWCFYRAARTAVQRVQHALLKLPEGERKSRWQSLQDTLAKYRDTVDEEIMHALTHLAGAPTLLMINNPPGALQGMCMWIDPDPTHHPVDHSRIECVAVVMAKTAGPALHRASVLVPSDVLSRGAITFAAVRVVAEAIVGSRQGREQRASAEQKGSPRDPFLRLLTVTRSANKEVCSASR